VFMAVHPLRIKADWGAAAMAKPELINPLSR
jgi:hypothetical protein